jgi:truncated hemoglobin YjbI
MQSVAKPPLYDRLGGVYSIATVVDDFIDRIMVDPRLNANPLVDVAHHRVPPAGFKYLVTEMVCWATGGPQKYTGKSMADSHKDLQNYRRRVGGVSGRFSADPGQVQGTRGGTSRTEGNRQQYPS